MPKSNSQPQTIISAKAKRLKKKPRWVEERTQRAADYYARTKKDDLRSAKLIYLKTIGEEQQAGPIRRRPKDGRQGEEESHRLRRLARLKERVYREESQSQQPANYMAQEALQSQPQSESSLSSSPHYPLTALHLATLQVQRVVDGWLHFHLNSRNKRSLPRTDLINYLKTTQYALNPDRYLRIIAAYNRRAYRWEEDRIFCQSFTREEIQARVGVTRNRMMRKQVEGLFL